MEEGQKKSLLSWNYKLLLNKGFYSCSARVKTVRSHAQPPGKRRYSNTLRLQLFLTQCLKCFLNSNKGNSRGFIPSWEPNKSNHVLKIREANVMFSEVFWRLYSTFFGFKTMKELRSAWTSCRERGKETKYVLCLFPTQVSFVTEALTLRWAF